MGYIAFDAPESEAFGVLGKRDRAEMISGWRGFSAACDLILHDFTPRERASMS